MFPLSILQRLFGGGEPAVPDAPESFGYKIGWLCIKTSDSEGVAKSLGLTAVKPSTWKDGVHSVYGEKRYPYQLIFVTPPLDGWTFAVGSWVAEVGGETDPHQDIAKLEQLAKRLSTEFDEAQAFVSERAIDYHVWILAREGKLLRSFGYVGEEGEVLRNEGTPTDAEKDFAWPTVNKDWFPSEKDVMHVAAKWSLDPTEIKNRSASTTLGILGEAH
jgi:hypothetical protein